MIPREPEEEQSTEEEPEIEQPETLEEALTEAREKAESDFKK